MTRTEAIEQARGPLAMTEANWRKVVAGEKWQTRRIVNPPPPEDMPADCIHCDFYNPVKVDKHGEEYPGKEVYGAYDTFGEWGMSTKYQPGEIYYLPEPVQLSDFTAPNQVFKAMFEGAYLWEISKTPNRFRFNVPDDDLKKLMDRKGPKNWKQEGWKAPTTARFMLKSFAREFVWIKSVKVERLQDITEQDAIAEGCEGEIDSDFYAKIEFMELWNSIHGADAWSANPWVWVYRFERMEVAG